MELYKLQIAETLKMLGFDSTLTSHLLEFWFLHNTEVPKSAFMILQQHGLADFKNETINWIRCNNPTFEQLKTKLA